MTTIDERLDTVISQLRAGVDPDTKQLHITEEDAKQAIRTLFLDLIAEAKPEERVATSWQQGIEVKAFEDAVRVYEYKLKQAIGEK